MKKKILINLKELAGTINNFYWKIFFD